MLPTDSVYISCFQIFFLVLYVPNVFKWNSSVSYFYKDSNPFILNEFIYFKRLGIVVIAAEEFHSANESTFVTGFGQNNFSRFISAVSSSFSYFQAANNH